MSKWELEDKFRFRLFSWQVLRATLVPCLTEKTPQHTELAAIDMWIYVTCCHHHSSIINNKPSLLHWVQHIMRTDRLGNVAKGVDLKIKSPMARYTMIITHGREDWKRICFKGIWNVSQQEKMNYPHPFSVLLCAMDSYPFQGIREARLTFLQTFLQATPAPSHKIYCSPVETPKVPEPKHVGSPSCVPRRRVFRGCWGVDRHRSRVKTRGIFNQGVCGRVFRRSYSIYRSYIYIIVSC